MVKTLLHCLDLSDPESTAIFKIQSLSPMWQVPEYEMSSTLWLTCGLNVHTKNSFLLEILQFALFLWLPLLFCFIVLFFFYLFLIHCYSPFICFDGACDIKKKKNSVSREHEQNLWGGIISWVWKLNEYSISPTWKRITKPSPITLQSS